MAEAICMPEGNNTAEVWTLTDFTHERPKYAEKGPKLGDKFIEQLLVAIITTAF